MRVSSYKAYIDTLTKISKAITSDLYLEDVLRLVVSLTASVMKAKICSLWLLDKEAGTLKIRATQAMDKEYLKERILKVGEGVVGKVAKKKKILAIYNVLEDKDYKEKELAKKLGLISMLSVPMMLKSKVVGVINCYTVEPYKFTKNDKDMVSTVANQAAVAIENTELMVQSQIVKEELASRKKIERAKGILMKQRKLSEDEAYALIRKTSMNKRLPMKDVSEAIILSYEVK